jgi:hypothetical protein
VRYIAVPAGGEGVTWPLNRKSRPLKSEDGEVFERIKEDNAINTKLKQWATLSKPIYMIVGLLITSKVTYWDNSSSEAHSEMTAKPPTKLGKPWRLVGHPSTRRSTWVSTDWRNVQARLTGPRIFAIEYRVLRKRLLSTSGGLEVPSTASHGDWTFDSGNPARAQVELMQELIVDDDSSQRRLTMRTNAASRFRM